MASWAGAHSRGRGHGAFITEGNGTRRGEGVHLPEPGETQPQRRLDKYE